MIRHRHLHTHTHTRAHVHVHTHTMIHTTCTHTHIYITHTHTHTHTHRADEKVAAAVGSPVSLMLCSPPPPPPHGRGVHFRVSVEGSLDEVCFQAGFKRHRESGLCQNRVPHTGTHTGHPILKRRCISTFQVNMWDRELFVRRRSKGSAGSVKTETV